GSPARSLLQTPEDLAFWDEVAAGSADEGASLDSETTLQAPDGAQRHLRRQVRWLPVAPGCSERWLLVSVYGQNIGRRAKDDDACIVLGKPDQPRFGRSLH
ncbi:MAG TPA: hypothetical protein PLF63_13595, partial [Rubrivivax sp.]|nr:hypothetical protein [Rubrivivax sp.]